MTCLRLLAAGLAGLALSCQSLIGLPDRSHEDGSGGQGGSAAGGGAGGAGGKAAQCSAFCKRAVEICEGDYAIYHGPGDCEPACQLLTPEQIKCRDDELTKASSSREYWEHCQAATLGGSDACGGNCKNYCSYVSQVCVADNREMSEADLTPEECVDKCGKLVTREFQLGMPAETPRFNIDKDHEGDSLQCRLVHLTIAAGPGAADSHCWHAALAPRPAVQTMQTNPCATGLNETAPHCSDYCHIVDNACDDDKLRVYENDTQCMEVCSKLAPGNVSEQTGDTVGCRKTHAYNALLVAADTHCPHAGPGGAGVCGSDCPAYCKLFRAGCADVFATAFGMANDANSKCETGCRALIGDDPLKYSVADAKASNGNPLSCRLLNAARALEKPEQAAMFCPNAAGGGTCKR